MLGEVSLARQILDGVADADLGQPQSGDRDMVGLMSASAAHGFGSAGVGHLLCSAALVGAVRSTSVPFELET